MEKVFEPKVVAFACENSACLAAEHAVSLSRRYPERVEIIKIPCSGRVDVIFVLKALEKADGVMVLACQKDNCKFLSGNVRAAKRVGQARKLLSEIGIKEERVQIIYLAANMGHKFADSVQNYYDFIRELGPNPGKVT